MTDQEEVYQEDYLNIRYYENFIEVMIDAILSGDPRRIRLYMFRGRIDYLMRRLEAARDTLVSQIFVDALFASAAFRFVIKDDLILVD